MERAHHRAAGRRHQALQRDQADGGRHFAKDADADAPGAGARRARHTHRLSHHSAACGLRANRARPLAMASRRTARLVGAGPCERHPRGADEVRSQKALKGREMERWPELPYAAWKDTCATLQLWTQIVGKTRLMLTPWVNHSWHVTFEVTARGLGTPLFHADARGLQIEFDFIDHQLWVCTSD